MSLKSFPLDLPPPGGGGGGGGAGALNKGILVLIDIMLDDRTDCRYLCLPS